MEGIEIEFIGGNCPVQAEGTIDGKRFYFRARYDSWRVEINPEATTPFLKWSDAHTVWSYGEQWGEQMYDAGWMPEDVALEKISMAAELYRKATSSS